MESDEPPSQYEVFYNVLESEAGQRARLPVRCRALYANRW